MPKNVRTQPAYVPEGDAEKMNQPSLLYPGQLGIRFTITQPGPLYGVPGAEQYRDKTYQIVKTDSTMAVSPYKGAVAWWADQANYSTTTDPTKLGRGRVAGVYQFAITKGNFGTIQVQGPATVKFVDVPTAEPSAAGLIAIPSATAAKADCLGAGTAATYPALGRTTSVRDPASEAIVDLELPEVP